MGSQGSTGVKMTDIMERCAARGFKATDIERVVNEYEEMNVWQVNQKRDRVTFLF